MITKYFALLVLLLSVQISANATKLKNVYLDALRNVHVVTVGGADIKVTNDSRGMLTGLSPDKKSAVWLVKDFYEGETGAELGPNILAVFRNGKVRTIECQQIIRRYWFWMSGKSIAIDCGGKHFAGRETLYDLEDLRVLESFDQADVPVESRPAWSKSRAKGVKQSDLTR